jgi:glutamate-1-semialdehyde 2,1-aminomutase
MNRVGSMMSLFFTEREVTDYSSAASGSVEVFKAYFRGMLANGIYLAPSAFEASFVSSAHDRVDIERTIEACWASLKDLRS